MRTFVALLLGLVAALFPWLPSCPAYLSAAALPPYPPRGGLNSTGSAQAQDSLHNITGGANSNSVHGAMKVEARIPLSINDPPLATNCSTQNGCNEEHPIDFETRNASSSEEGREVDVVDLRSDVAPEVPISVRNDDGAAGHSEEDDPVPGLNRIETPGYAGEGENTDSKSLLQDNSFQSFERNKTQIHTGATPNGLEAPSVTTSSTSTFISTKRLGISVVGTLNEANHVFTSSADEGIDTFEPKISAKEMEKINNTISHPKEASTMPVIVEGPEEVSVTNMSTSDVLEEESLHSDIDEDSEEDDEEGVTPGWEQGSKFSATPDFPLEHNISSTEDDHMYHFKKFASVEYGEKNDTDTTRSYLVIENSTHVDYFSSNVVSEAYDTEIPEDDSFKATSSLPSSSHLMESGLVSNNSEALTDSSDVHLSSDDHVEEEEEDIDEVLEGEFHSTVTPVGEKNIGDLEADTGESSVVSAHVSLPTVANLSTITSTEGMPIQKNTTWPSEVFKPLLNSSESDFSFPITTPMNDSDVSVVKTTTQSTVTQTEIKITTEKESEISLIATTFPSTSKNSSYTAIRQPSTTESSVKNEVTYNDNITGPIYDFKANISLTTPIIVRTASTTITSTTESIKWDAFSTTPSPFMSKSSFFTESYASPVTSTEYASSTTSSLEQSKALNTSENLTTESNGEADTLVTVSSEITTQKPSSISVIEMSENSTTVSSTESSSILFTTVKQNRVTELVIGSMSSTSEDSVTSTEQSTSVINKTDNDTVMEVTTRVNQNQSIFNSTESSISITFTPEIKTSNFTYETSIELSTSPSTAGSNISPSPSSSLENEDTKIPLVTLVHTSDIQESPTQRNVEISKAIVTEPSTASEMSESKRSKDYTTPNTFTTKEDLESSQVSMSSSTVQGNDVQKKGTTPSILEPTEKISSNDTEISIKAYPAYIRLWMKISWDEICKEELQLSLKSAVAQLISTATQRSVPLQRVILLNFEESCPSNLQVKESLLSPVYFCILPSAETEQFDRRKVHNQNRDKDDNTVVHCDSVLTELFPHLWTQAPQPMDDPLQHVKEVDLVRSKWGTEDGLEYPQDPDDNSGVFAAIGISCVAALCLILIGALLIIMRRRQRRFNYGQRCTPVSLDAYSLDNVSVREDTRRRRTRPRNGDSNVGANGLGKRDTSNDWRASKRSYGNPAFEDDDGEEVLLSKPMNFAALTNAAANDDGSLADEFKLIPKKFYKRSTRRKSRSRQRDVSAAERGEAGTVGKDAGEEDEGLPEGAEEKNRYANVIPLVPTRVKLSLKSSGPLSTYINANYVRGPKNEEKFYIACQAPLNSTIEDFWRMIWEQQSKVILMLTTLVENGVEKCADYLPPSEVLDCHRLFGDYQVTLKKREVREKYIVSSLQLKDMESNLWREVTHLWFLGWPVTGVPDEPSQIIAFLIEARPFMQANTGPTVVHCSPGTGRTGTVIAIDICIRDFEQSRMVDVPRVVQQLRRDRDGAVQTKLQYAFIYQALSMYATKLTGGAMESF